MPRRIDVAGRTIGRATVLGDAPRSRSGRCRVQCKCSCGTGFVCDPRLLLNGQTTSCGCRHRESVTLAGALNGTHRMSRTTEYNTWIKIRDRCKNPRNVGISRITAVAEYPSVKGGTPVLRHFSRTLAQNLTEIGPSIASTITGTTSLEIADGLPHRRKHVTAARPEWLSTMVDKCHW